VPAVSNSCTRIRDSSPGRSPEAPLRCLHRLGRLRTFHVSWLRRSRPIQDFSGRLQPVHAPRSVRARNPRVSAALPCWPKAVPLPHAPRTRCPRLPSRQPCSLAIHRVCTAVRLKSWRVPSAARKGMICLRCSLRRFDLPACLALQGPAPPERRKGQARSIGLRISVSYLVSFEVRLLVSSAEVLRVSHRREPRPLLSSL
jgi:hypothetical protein